MKPIVIGIAGGSGAGKSTVIGKIIQAFGQEHIALLEHDHYYKDLAQHPVQDPAKINFDHPSALETELLIEHLRELKAGRPIQRPIYNFTTHRRLPDTVRIEPRDVIIVDGILIFADRTLRSLLDIKIFIDTPADIRLIRRIRRDILQRGRSLESILHQYETTVRPMHYEFVEPSKEYADIIIPRGGENEVAIELVISRIRTLLMDRTAQETAG